MEAIVASNILMLRHRVLAMQEEGKKMEKKNVGFSVLVNGKPIKEYTHKCKTYVEGRHKSEFTLRLTNNTSERKLFVISVDGLSIMDGEKASIESNGYIVNAYQEVDIPGWRLDSEEVAKFFFTVKEQEESYAEQTGHSDKNTGVIGLRVYNEERPRTPMPYWHRGTEQWRDWPYRQPRETYSDDRFPNIRFGATRSANIIGSGAEATLSDFDLDALSEELGTGFGDATDFSTQSVNFNKGTLHMETAIFYDTLRGLKARGVPIEKPKRSKIHKEANPFPGDTFGCTPPNDWKPKKKRRNRSRRKSLTK